MKKNIKAKENKKPIVNVERQDDSWIVRNDGDSAVLFTASEKPAAVKFAKEMAKNHGLEVFIEDEKKNAIKKEVSGIAPAVIVYFEKELWVVKNEGDSSALFSAADKDASIKFASEMAKNHSIELIIEDSVNKNTEDKNMERNNSNRNSDREKDLEREGERDKERDAERERERKRERDREDDREQENIREREWKKEVREREIKWQEEVREREEQYKKEREERDRNYRGEREESERR